MKMRVPLVYTASEIVNWHISEQDPKTNKWRPSRPCGFWDITHLNQQFKLAWRVFIGQYDVLNWGEGSGTGRKAEEYRDCRDPQWIRANKMAE